MRSAFKLVPSNHWHQLLKTRAHSSSNNFAQVNLLEGTLVIDGRKRNHPFICGGEVAQIKRTYMAIESRARLGSSGFRQMKV